MIEARVGALFPAEIQEYRNERDVLVRIYRAMDSVRHRQLEEPD